MYASAYALCVRMCLQALAGVARAVGARALCFSFLCQVIVYASADALCVRMGLPALVVCVRAVDVRAFCFSVSHLSAR